MKVAVYTALFGDKDVLRPPLGYNEADAVSYFAFSDKVLDVYPYTSIVRPLQFADIAKNARYFKILGDPILKAYDVLIWHDANIQLYHTEIKNLVSLSSKSFLTTFKHPDRDDFYSEAMTCVRVDKDFSLRILKQACVYFFNGMPAHQGMYATGIFVKNYQHHSNKVLEFWWEQTLAFSRRDQLSLAYTIYKKNLNITLIPDDILNNRYSKYYLHNYNYYKEKQKVMDYNFWVFKKISFFSIKLMRKLKKIV